MKKLATYPWQKSALIPGTDFISAVQATVPIPIKYIGMLLSAQSTGIPHRYPWERGLTTLLILQHSADI